MLALGLAVMGGAAACSRATADPAEFVGELLATYQRRDAPAFAAGWTERGFRQAFGLDRQVGERIPPSWDDATTFHESQLEVLAVETMETGRVRVAVEVETGEQGSLHRYRLDLVWRDGGWMVDRRTALPPTLAVAPIEVELGEYRVDLSAEPMREGAVLRVENRGTVEHQLVVLRSQGDADTTVAREASLAPGDIGFIAWQGLPAGSYALVCNLLDPEGRPHAALGMRTEIELR